MAEYSLPGRSTPELKVFRVDGRLPEPGNHWETLPPSVTPEEVGKRFAWVQCFFPGTRRIGMGWVVSRRWTRETARNACLLGHFPSGWDFEPVFRAITTGVI